MLFRNQNKERHIDNILKRPLIDIRVDASEAFKKSELKQASFNKLVVRMHAAIPSLNYIDDATFNHEYEKVKNAMETGISPEPPDLSNPLLQLLWGTAMATMITDTDLFKKWSSEPTSDAQNKKKKSPSYKLVHSQLWDQIKQTSFMKNDLAENALTLASTSLVNKDVSLRWGGTQYPGIGYYFKPEKNIINLDMLWALILGLEHCRSTNFHEIAHSQGTLFTPKLDELQARAKQCKKGKLTPEEYKEKRNIMAEYSSRFYIFDECENNFADGFVRVLYEKGIINQDLRDSLNVWETSAVCGKIYQENRKGKLLTPFCSENVDALTKEILVMKTAIRYSFYARNELFDNTDAGWRKIGVEVSKLRGKDKHGNPITGRDCLNDIMAACHKIEKLQIPLSIQGLTTEEAKNKVKSIANERGQIIDDLYDRYFKDLYDKQREKLMDNIDKKMEEMRNSNGQNCSSSQKGEGESASSSSNFNDDEDINDDDLNGSSSNGMGDSDDISSGCDSEDYVDGVGNMPSQSAPKDSAEEERNKDKDLEDSDKGKSLEDLLNEATGHKKEDETKDKEKNKEKNEDKETPEQKAERQKKQRQERAEFGRKLTTYHQGGGVKAIIPKEIKSLNEYTSIISKYTAETEDFRKMFVRLANEYETSSQKRVNELLPKELISSNNLDMNSIKNLRTKRMMGQALSINDFKHFRNPVAPEKKKAPIDICILIDNSGSMGETESVLENGKMIQKTRKDFAIELGCILFESTRHNDAFNVYVSLMTDEDNSIAEPGDKEEDIARRLATCYGPMKYCGDDHIGPAIKQILGKISSRPLTSEREGETHFFFITDGNHTDSSSSFPLVKRIINSKAKITFNWLLTANENDSYCYVKTELMPEVKDKVGPQQPKVVFISKPSQIKENFSKILNARIMEMKNVTAQSITLKRRSLADIVAKERE